MTTNITTLSQVTVYIVEQLTYKKDAESSRKAIYSQKNRILFAFNRANNSLCRLFVAKMCDEITTMEQLCCQ